jgi:hypothetical protein
MLRFGEKTPFVREFLSKLEEQIPSDVYLEDTVRGVNICAPESRTKIKRLWISYQYAEENEETTWQEVTEFLSSMRRKK